MKDPTIIHPLAQKDKKSGKIRYIQYGKEHRFYSVINRLTGCRMSAFDNDPPSVDDDLSWVKSAFKKIRAQEKVLEVIGDF